MNPIREITEKFGGIRPTARALTVPVATVQSWVAAGSIPSPRIPEILQKAKAAGVELALDDFFAKQSASTAAE